ncbi:MAG: hypothetical protein ACI4P6_03955 [Candidatus Spyradosoma sp.]
MNVLKKLFVGIIVLCLSAGAFSGCMSPEERMKLRIQEEKEAAWNKVKKDLCSEKPVEWKNALKEVKKLAEQGNSDAINLLYYLSFNYLSDYGEDRRRSSATYNKYSLREPTLFSEVSDAKNYLYYTVYSKEDRKNVKVYFITRDACSAEMVSILRKCAMEKRVPFAENCYCRLIWQKWAFRRNFSAGLTASWHTYVIQGGDYNLTDLIELDKRNVDIALDGLASVVFYSRLNGFDSTSESSECVDYFFKKYFNENTWNARAIKKMSRCIIWAQNEDRENGYWGYENKTLTLLEHISKQGDSNALDALLGLAEDPDLWPRKRQKTLEALLNIKNDSTVKEKYPQLRAHLLARMKEIQQGTEKLDVYEYIENNFLNE